MYDVATCGVKDVERILDGEIHNWIRWARQRNYLPASVRCVLGQLHIRSEDDKKDEMIVVNPLPPDEMEAEAFEKAINSLPKRERQAVILHFLDRGHVGLITVRAKDQRTKAMIMGVGARQYRVIQTRAMQMLLARWQAAGLVE